MFPSTSGMQRKRPHFPLVCIVLRLALCIRKEGIQKRWGSHSPDFSSFCRLSLLHLFLSPPLIAAAHFNSLFQMLSLLELSSVSILPEVRPSCCSVSSWFILTPLASKIALSAGKFTFGLGRKVSFWKGA